jgi:hypothetical protein
MNSVAIENEFRMTTAYVGKKPDMAADISPVELF